jgi:hypothetical protein
MILGGTALSLVFVSSINVNFTYAQTEKFKAQLKGDKEVPPVNTTATGKAKFKVKDDKITSNINVTGIADVSGAQIFYGAKSENGQPIVDLLKTGNKTNSGDRIIIKGEITATDLGGSMAGKTLQDLKTAMAGGNTYVNIQTSEHPDGEIRGQIKASGGNETSTISNATSSAVTED